MSFTTGIYNASWNHLFYVCKVRVYPNGRLLHYSYPQGHTSYWFHRLRVDVRFASCADVLTIGFIPEETTQQLLQPEELQLTCRESFPKIYDSKHRIISLSWHTENGSTDLITSELDVQVSAYMRFEGNFGLIDKIQRCEDGSGFWCGNDTAMCIYGQMRCDQADGCFDGGSDEAGCPPPRNYTVTLPIRKPWGAWTTYLPWTATCLIPLILIFVLGLICTPRKSLEDLEDEETNQLKANSPTSRTSSSASASPRESLRSTHSAIVISHRTTNEMVQRASSNPDLLATAPAHTVIINEPTGIGSRRQLPKTCYVNHSWSSGQFFPHPALSKPSKKFQTVSFQDSSVNPGLFNVALDAKAFNSWLRYRQESGTLYEAGSKEKRMFGMENKVFALPAHFEIAAARIRDKTGQAWQNQQHTRTTDSLELANFHKRYAESSQMATNRHQFPEVEGHMPESPPGSNSSSTESHLEDGTPFRKPDPHMALQSNGQHNGGLFSSIFLATLNGPSMSKKSNRRERNASSKSPFLKHPLDSPPKSCDRSSDFLLL